MDLLGVIRGRVSVRKYKNNPIEREKLERVLEAMRLAPSAGNRQKWLFYAVLNQDKKAKLAEATGLNWVSDASTVLAVVGTDCGVMTNGHRSDTVDLSIALSFGMLEAASLGLGTCWIAHYEEKDVRAALDIPEEYSVAALLTLGYAGEAPAPRPRKSRDDVVRMMVEDIRQ